ncbi:putative bifunctional diguanylate cyclase/phosphodiesterase [Sphingomonas azotifigens]|uniref:putative bifunctional diguanylate cyclase/phosphodiesterase n=1 Tax=Sphingomonas azotifigens TaxID=330920 RepID=UPI000A0681EF|nr:EAL domain-containing protein [Sphingomonas azotifigens]
MDISLQNNILELVATGADLASVADRLCREVELRLPDVRCLVLRVDVAGRLHPVAGPSFPEHYLHALDGMMIGPRVGSCGAAAYHGEPHASTDIETDPNWARYLDLTRPLELRACWSNPIKNGRGEVTGVVAFYYRVPRGPTPLERRIIRVCLHLCSIAIEQDIWRAKQVRRAQLDGLTGLPNRAAFATSLSDLDCSEPGGWGLILVDLDNLKIVNDTFGHVAGDALITHAARRLAETAAPDRAYRLGGDEFAVLLQSPEALADPAEKARRLLDAIAQPVSEEDRNLLPRATAGGALIGEGETAEQVRLNADLALYHAKETARGTFVRYWPGIATRMAKRLEAIHSVERALAEDRLLPFYQPILDLRSGELVGFEALCRMRAGDRIISAAEFFEATTDGKVAGAITDRMLERVAADLRRWCDFGIAPRHVGMNFSSSDFHGGRLRELIPETLARHGVPLHHLTLEITETVYLGQGDTVVADTLRWFRSQGLMVALDDFGTGYASLTHLLTMPVDYIKIDKSFTDQLLQNSASRAIVEGVLHIAQELDMGVIAEGVETESQAELLRSIGCAYGQGHLFSPAIDAARATEMLHAARATSPRLSSNGMPTGHDPAAILH